MVDVQIVFVCGVVVLSMFRSLGIIGQPTIDHSSNDDSSTVLENRCEFEIVENTRLQGVVESKRQKIEALENELHHLRAQASQSCRLTISLLFILRIVYNPSDVKY